MGEIITSPGKRSWTPEEDKKLFDFVQHHGHGTWRSLPEKAGLARCGKSCRLRWRNYLDPDIKRGSFSLHEDQTIIQLHSLLGNRWSTIAAQLPKRTDNEIKNYWNSHLKKRLAKMGIDPVTHKPIQQHLNNAILSNLNHIAQWESVRLQAEARFSTQQSKLLITTTTTPAAPRSGSQCFDDMISQKAKQVLLLLKSVLAADDTQLQVQVGQINEGVVTYGGPFEAPPGSGTSVMDFNNGLFGESGGNNEYGDELLDASLLEHGHNDTTTGFATYWDGWSLDSMWNCDDDRASKETCP